MILGIGVDIVNCDRFLEKVEDRAFLNKIFDEKEISYCSSKGIVAYQSYAGTFAAKEAFSKALGEGFGKLKPKDIVVERDSLGKPYIVNKYKNIGNIFLSISHEKDNAIAFVIVEGV